MLIDRRTFVTTALSALVLAASGGMARANMPEPLTIPGGPIEGLTLAPELYPTIVAVKRDLEVGSVHVISSQHYLYYIARKGTAIRYGVAVGRAELVFRGAAVVGEMREWPDWRPTDEMIERSPEKYKKYEDGMPGGPTNPLGARAIYLHQNGIDTAIRIHGTIDPNSIGTSVSNGCLRMVNDHVIDLYARVRLGTPVTVY